MHFEYQGIIFKGSSIFTNAFGQGRGCPSPRTHTHFGQFDQISHFDFDPFPYESE